jgi:hypothetical protein
MRRLAQSAGSASFARTFLGLWRNLPVGGNILTKTEEPVQQEAM